MTAILLSYRVVSLCESVANCRSEWEEAVGKRRSQEAHFLARREERIDDNEAQIQHLRRRNMEDYNRIKIKLETDIQTLQQQIQQMKATYLLNAEKLEYNFQVSPYMRVCVIVYSVVCAHKTEWATAAALVLLDVHLSPKHC